MSIPTAQIEAEQEQERALEEAIAKALDFSDLYADIERIEKTIEDLK
jgi:hypothetical protein